METLIIPRNSWNDAIKGVKKGSRNTMLFLIIASRIRVSQTHDVKYSEYQSITGRRLNNFQEIRGKITEAHHKKPPSKSYLHVPLWFFKIPMKNTFELKVAHYKITQDHDRGYSKKYRYDFKQFCDKYEVKNNKDSRYKFNQLIPFTNS